MPPVNRREALQLTTGIVGAAMVSSALLSACGGEAPPAAGGAATLTADDRRLMEEIADALLPTTPSSPGAKAAGAGEGMALLLIDCYDAAAQRRMTDGLAALRSLCSDRCGGDFTKLSPTERERLLVEIDAEAVRMGDGHWFHLMREVALRAYFSTEIGMTQALRYVRVPGRWTGCVPLEPGQPAWG
jgi:hypothetical protein